MKNMVKLSRNEFSGTEPLYNRFSFSKGFAFLIFPPVTLMGELIKQSLLNNTDTERRNIARIK